jgi:mRNA degradation ribonuclease J1/J2
MEKSGAVIANFLISKKTKSFLESDCVQLGVAGESSEARGIVNEIFNSSIESLKKEIPILLSGNLNDPENNNIKNFKKSVEKVLQKKYRKEFDKEPLILTNIIIAN